MSFVFAVYFPSNFYRNCIDTERLKQDSASHGETIWTSVSILPGQITVTDFTISGRYGFHGDDVVLVLETVIGKMLISNFDDDDTDNVDVQDTVSSTYLTNETRRQLKCSNQHNWAR